MSATAAGAPVHEQVAGARAFLEAALGPRPGWVSVVLPAPRATSLGDGPEAGPPLAIFDAPEGESLVGWGAAHEIVRDDHDLTRVRAEARRVAGETERLFHEDVPQALRRPLAWIGGTSFVPGAPRDPVWRDFPDACFVAPRWTHRVAGAAATIELTCRPEVLAPGAAERLGAAYAAWALREAAPAPAAGAARARAFVAGDARRWREQVAAALAAIEAGTLRKVVLARHLDLPGDGDPVRVLADLGRRFPACTRFLFQRGASAFFGATPETLVRVRGAEVTAEALAGSAPAAEHATLAGNAKERLEHALVVDDVVARLRALCREVEHAPAPAVRLFDTVAHLWTPIRGVLERPAHVLDVLARLHPTPAVAGTPTASALRFLAATEAVGRGWYAAPFGWFDVEGDGHFVVALRCCVRHPGGLRLYAGAGIVTGSRPERELEETALKMRAMLETLDAVADQPASRVG